MQTKIKRLKKLSAEWNVWLVGDEKGKIKPHSLWSQYNCLVRNHNTYRAILKAIQLTHEKEEGNSFYANNVALFLFTKESYFAYQIMGIRRLVDDTKNTHSLFNLLKEMEKEIAGLTREEYLAWLDFHPCPETLNDRFDELENKREQKIVKKYWANLKKELQEENFLRIQKFSHKFIAHTEKYDTRLVASDELGGITMEDIESCHKAIYFVLQEVYSDFWASHMSPSSIVSNLDTIESMDKPFTTKDIFDEVSGHISKK